MKITSIERPLEGCELWAGMAINEGTRLEWFIELDGSSLRIREEETRCHYIDENGDQRYCFMNIDPPDGAKKIILRAIRASLS